MLSKDVYTPIQHQELAMMELHIIVWPREAYIGQIFCTVKHCSDIGSCQLVFTFCTCNSVYFGETGRQIIIFGDKQNKLIKKQQTNLKKKKSWFEDENGTGVVNLWFVIVEEKREGVNYKLKEKLD